MEVPVRTKNELGKKFGKLTVIEYVGSYKYYNSGTSAKWSCKCDCGNQIEAWGVWLRQDDIKSCGCLKQQFRKFRSGAEQALWHTYKGRYKNRDKNRDFCLSQEEFFDIIIRPCYYCGNALGNEMKCKKENFKYTGIDRVDNSRGYVKDNIVPCCKKCNMMKRDHGQKEFLDHTSLIHHYGLFGSN